MNNDKRYEIILRMQDHTPHPTTELVYRSPFELLIAVILSAQATDISVNKATQILFSYANTPQDIITLGIDNLKIYIKSIGLFNIKAKNIIKTCQILLEQYKSKVPQNRKKLETLPGVGRKTANVVLNSAFGWPTIAVDRHVFRVSNRTRFARGKNVTLVEKKLLSVVPREFKKTFHHWFVSHGRYTCTSKKPRCNVCIIRDLCEYDKKYYVK
ncbi:endonuclease III, DNA-(apurinic or apyrimidinic site) lyase [secondary endosymbiont of Heteropsylla cubana]|uniref:Endonuclease III n=1 Tax=secondary endosymbiont of Heteropsylla cubana TaxID=134287 RepID=J3Z523_9ENTR|nr:endonuclease III [secondary endosymbiont of Heteropsylla cubana]AFP85384.1 endonuclease III, DNA-(apurinic or apyrimidinic site) lyase [secondary endosymbiont of Heteropsylla cubana]